MKTKYRFSLLAKLIAGFQPTKGSSSCVGVWAVCDLFFHVRITSISNTWFCNFLVKAILNKRIQNVFLLLKESLSQALRQTCPHRTTACQQMSLKKAYARVDFKRHSFLAGGCRRRHLAEGEWRVALEELQAPSDSAGCVVRLSLVQGRKERPAGLHSRSFAGRTELEEACATCDGTARGCPTRNGFQSQRCTARRF